MMYCICYCYCTFSILLLLVYLCFISSNVNINLPRDKGWKLADCYNPAYLHESVYYLFFIKIKMSQHIPVKWKHLINKICEIKRHEILRKIIIKRRLYPAVSCPVYGLFQVSVDSVGNVSVLTVAGARYKFRNSIKPLWTLSLAGK